MAETVHYRFLPYVRRGMAAALTTPDTLGVSQLPAVASFNAALPVLTEPGGIDPSPVVQAVALYGPGDVTGLMRNQIVRTWPLADATDAEPSYFPLLEFDRPDLPWLFTPAAANDRDRLRPWIALLVFEQPGGEDDAQMRQGQPLSVVVVPGSAAWQLPEPNESWLWAHGQVTPDEGETVDAALTSDPRHNLSRLLCPRRLRPNMQYLACAAPAFDIGRKAGLGEPITQADEANLAPAWEVGTAVTLPVYFHWTFATGGEGDFETLARRLQGRPLPDGVGRRSLDISHAGGGLPEVELTGIEDTRGVVGLDGALRRPLAAPSPWDEGAAAPFVVRLSEVLDTPARLATANEQVPGPHTVAPPIYGEFHALCATIGEGSPPVWLRELNLDPRPRVAAGLGTQVVQARQEDFMARAWRQVGDIVAANRALRFAQLARAAATPVHTRYLTPLSATDLLAVSAALHARVRNVLGPGTPTLDAAIRASRLPSALASTTFRRLTRPFGAIARSGSDVVTNRTTIAALADGTLSMQSPDRAPDGTNVMRPPSEVLGRELAAQVMAKIEGRSGPTDDRFADRLDSFVRAINKAAASMATGEVLASQPVVRDTTAALALQAVGAVRDDLVRPAPPGLGLPGAQLVGPPVGLTRGGRPLSRPGELVMPPTGPAPRPDAFAPRVVPTLLDGGARLGRLSERWGPELLIGTGMTARLDVSAVDRILRNGSVQIPVDVISVTVGAGTFAVPARPVLNTEVLPVGPTDAQVLDELVLAVRVAADRIVVTSDAPEPPEGPPLPLDDVRDGLLTLLKPERTILARISARLSVKALRTVIPADPLEQIMASPIFLDSMYEPLRDLSEEWLLPGLDLVPLDTATLVETNPSFVASYLVGLNHEMARELLWREFPTDQRGTCFARFWGRPRVDDIGAVHFFHDSLTDNILGGPRPQLVLLIRGELLRRYPGAIIYAAQARLVGDELSLDESTILPPDFRGTLRPDTTFVGFPLTVDEVIGAAAVDWWFVIAEQPTEPRFGLDDSAKLNPGEPGWTWNDLAWAHVASAPDRVAEIVYPPAIAPPALAAVAPDGVRWGSDSAGQAHATFQHPVRVAIRAKALLSQEVA